MKKIILYITLLWLNFSCKEEPTNMMRIFIKNATSDTLEVSLFPKKEYMSNSTYDFNDIKGGGGRPTKFKISPYRDITQNDISYSNFALFSSKNINQTPQYLLNKIFDSIKIESKYGIMTFKKDTVIGYLENMFQDNSIWFFENSYEDFPTNFKDNPINFSDYSFIIFKN